MTQSKYHPDNDPRTLLDTSNNPSLYTVSMNSIIYPTNKPITKDIYINNYGKSIVGNLLFSNGNVIIPISSDNSTFNMTPNLSLSGNVYLKSYIDNSVSGDISLNYFNTVGDISMDNTSINSPIVYGTITINQYTNKINQAPIYTYVYYLYDNTTFTTNKIIYGVSGFITAQNSYFQTLYSISGTDNGNSNLIGNIYLKGSVTKSSTDISTSIISDYSGNFKIYSNTTIGNIIIENSTNSNVTIPVYNNQRLTNNFIGDISINGNVYMNGSVATKQIGKINYYNTLTLSNEQINIPYYSLDGSHNLSITQQTKQIDLNNYLISIPNPPTSVGYSVDEYIQSINTAITTTIISGGSNPATEINNTLFYNDENSIAHLKVQIDREFGNESYIIDLYNSALFTNPGTQIYSSTIKDYTDITPDIVTDISINNPIKYRFPINTGGYSFSNQTVLKINAYKTRTDISYGGNYYMSQIDASNNSSITSIPKFSSYSQLQEGINTFFRRFTTTEGISILYNSYVSMSVLPEDPTNVTALLYININDKLSCNNYELIFSNDLSENIYGKNINSWKYYAKFKDISYNLTTTTGIFDISGTDHLYGNPLILDKTNNQISFSPLSDINGLYDICNNIVLTIPIINDISQNFTRDQIIYQINQAFQNYQDPFSQEYILKYSSISVDTTTSNTKIILNINKRFTGKDFILDFYDPYDFATCVSKQSTTQNVRKDGTLGWILGYRSNTIYILADYVTSSGLVQVTGDTTLSVNIYNNFMIVLDDYNQNRLNDGLVTTSINETVLPLPSYTNNSLIYCNDANNQAIISPVSTNNTRLTQKQIYAAQTILDTMQNPQNNNYFSSPYANDVFALIPLKINGLPNNAIYSEFGGTLQNQERSYFGPVNLRRMTIQLLNDKGEIVDLNNANWSFSLICEQLYQGNPNKPN